MKRKYSTIKRALTYEQKIDRAEIYNLSTFTDTVDPEEFAKRDIFEEQIHLKCIKCGYEEITDFDIIEEICFDMDYPRLECPECGFKSNGELIPVDIYNQLQK